MVLLKDYSTKGFTFFTNYTSRKGQELEANPYASLLFYWDVMSRQIRIEGKVSKISREESIEYFGKRPFKSRVSAYISDQSKVIKDKKVFWKFSNYERAVKLRICTPKIGSIWSATKSNPRLWGRWKGSMSRKLVLPKININHYHITNWVLCIIREKGVAICSFRTSSNFGKATTFAYMIAFVSEDQSKTRIFLMRILF